ncbi:MAG: hydroxymethylpyrimidine/phosphomethylpyrimidine kinase [Prevotella sp.]|jgi:hydroxymethylpyrimidine/phosphomethylpyrimidine kinase|nr:hydroxymethylpyrimidine/phosphomethylpyrimidine kinase [Prevotella sp.]MCH4182468.1 hydroxymethylpyrimidine/phosphomethylpyrimidine kinase [Prevotella sp.]MCH4212505.1 hydroxymethylpyrimidine/phosphomethylpyrimidine kinase [Prevotella sp.]MCH4240548.1 hydroxymethylpyrimidine/phosphomethylpyrimidine kinase [Prevotella sp.]
MTTILTITGSDSTGGSGVQADIKTISALGGYALSAITSITIQNTLGIQAFYDIPAETVKGQMEAIINDMQPDVVKIGMIRNISTLQAIVGELIQYRPQYILYDPIVYSSNGDQLMSNDVILQIRHLLLPLCSIVIMRKNESELILGKNSSVHVLYLDDHQIHGQTNAFSSAIAVYLSRGLSEEEAVREARDYINLQVSRAQGPQSRSTELYNEFVDTVARHFQTNSDVAFYANCLNVSSRYLAQVTHRISGKSPKNIIDKTVTDAIEMELKTTRKTIQEIAYDFHFLSQAHFTKFFKKQTGLTPVAYRKAH